MNLTQLINDKTLSFKAKGIYMTIAQFQCSSVKELKEKGKESNDAIRSGILELEKFGYLKREKYQNNLGHWISKYTLLK